jgi:hypothetical protein
MKGKAGRPADKAHERKCTSAVLDEHESSHAV